MEKVRNFMLLYNLEKETMLKVISKSKITVYKPNEILFYQNSTPLNLYLVLSGEISFKKYSNTDLLTMIGSEENIILSKKYFDIKYLDSKMSLPFLHKLRDTAFHNFQEVSYKKIFTCGDVIGDENLITKAGYDNCAIVEKNAYVLTVDLNVFNKYLKKNVAKTVEDIKEFLLDKFKLFRKCDNNTFKFYKEFITKIYPKNGDFIYKEKEPSNKLYLIYQGKCAVQRNSKNLGNIIYLNKGDIFGYESLINLKPKWETVIKINIQINIQKCEYDIVCKDNRSIILVLDIPFCDELTTWKISKDLLPYFKEKNKIIQNLENIKKISSIIFEEKYNNLVKKRKNKSLNEDSRFNKNKNKYKLLVNQSIYGNKIYSNSKINNKRKVNFISNYAKIFPKNYFKNNIQMIKFKDTCQTQRKRKTDYISLLFNNIKKNNQRIAQKNEDIEDYLAPEKIIDDKGNIENITEVKEYKKQKNSEIKNASSSLLSNTNGFFNNSNSTRSTSTPVQIPLSDTRRKITTFESMPSNTQYKSKKLKTTFFQGFLLSNPKISKSITHRMKKNSSINTIKIKQFCSKFDIKKNCDKKNPLSFFSTFNSKQFNLTEIRGKTATKRPKDKLLISKYNFPFIYEVDDEGKVAF